MICFACKKSLKKGSNRHIYTCDKASGLGREEARCKHLVFNSKIELDCSRLEQLYLDEGKSLPDLKRLTGLSYRSLQWLLEHWEIKQRSVSEATSAENCISKRRQTCIEKYGEDNPSKLGFVKEKKAATFLLNYGVDNIWKAPEYYEWLHMHMEKKYGAKSVPNLYGNANPYGIKTISEQEKKERLAKAHKASKNWWASLSEENRQIEIRRRIKWMKDRPASFSSSLEERVADALSSLEIEHQRQKWIRRKSYDFFLEERRLIIEVQGTYWHGDNRVYGPNDKCAGGMLAKDKWQLDQEKKEIAESYGYDVSYIWEIDLHEMCEEDLKIHLQSYFLDI